MSCYVCVCVSMKFVRVYWFTTTKISKHFFIPNFNKETAKTIFIENTKALIHTKPLKHISLFGRLEHERKKRLNPEKGFI